MYLLSVYLLLTLFVVIYGCSLCGTRRFLHLVQLFWSIRIQLYAHCESFHIPLSYNVHSCHVFATYNCFVLRLRLHRRELHDERSTLNGRYFCMKQTHLCTSKMRSTPEEKLSNKIKYFSTRNYLVALMLRTIVCQRILDLLFSSLT